MVTDEATVSPSRFLQLLADEQRWRLLQELARSDRKVSELTELVGKPQNLVSYHLASLRNAGIVSARRSSADRRDTYYRIDMRRCADLLCGVGPALQPGLRLDVVDPRTLDGHPPRRRPSVLFLCTGNSARSQMAEALLEHHSGGTIRARSAGSHPKPLHPNAVRVMAERGIDISTRTSKHLDRFRRDAIRPGHHALRQGSGDLPAVPRGGGDRSLEHARSGFRGCKPTKRATRHSSARPRSSNRGFPFLIGELNVRTERRSPQ